MASGKKSFVLYCDIKHTVDHLSDSEAGILFKHIINYVNDLDPQSDNMLIKLAFEPIKQQLKRDLKKWETYIEKQRENGLKGGRPPIKHETQITQPLNEKPKKADNANVNVNANVSVTVKEEKENKFSPPSKEDVCNVFMEKLDDFTAMAESAKFINFYESNGWKVGKNKMKNWRAAAAGWVSRMNNFKTENNGHKTNGASNKNRGADQLIELLKQDFAAGRT